MIKVSLSVVMLTVTAMLLSGCKSEAQITEMRAAEKVKAYQGKSPAGNPVYRVFGTPVSKEFAAYKQTILTNEFNKEEIERLKKINSSEYPKVSLNEFDNTGTFEKFVIGYCKADGYSGVKPIKVIPVDLIAREEARDFIGYQVVYARYTFDVECINRVS